MTDIQIGDRVRVTRHNPGTSESLREKLDTLPIVYHGPSDVVGYKRVAFVNPIPWEPGVIQGDPDYAIAREIEKVEPETEKVPSWVTEKAPHVKVGDRVQILSRELSNSDNLGTFMEMVVGREGTVIGTVDEGRGYYSPGDGSPIYVNSDAGVFTYAGHYKVVAPVKEEVPAEGGAEPEEGEPDWADACQRVLAAVDQMAHDRDWCEEYEETMESLFDYEVKRVTWKVTVTLKLKTDLNEHIYDSVFGSADFLDDDTCVDSKIVEVETTVSFEMERQCEPDAEQVRAHLTDMDDVYFDDIELVSVTKV